MTRFAALAIALAVSVASRAEELELSLCGTSPVRDEVELAKHRFLRSRADAGRERALRDGPEFELSGDLVIVTDDGTLVSEANPFDLREASLRFTPDGSGYRVARGAEPIDPSAGIVFDIGDDATRVFDLSFPFPFYGREHRRVYLNSDGNLSFERGDHASSARSLDRFFSGPPRIAPFFTDLDPSEGGKLRVLDLPDRFVVTWNGVPEWGEELPNTLQVELTPDGAIRFRYGSTLNAGSGIVGVSPGESRTALELVDLSEGEHAAEGAVAEQFRSGRQIDNVALARAFYERFADRYDALVVWTNFESDADDAFAFSSLLRNDVNGIGEDIFDAGRLWGSERELESYVFMGDLSRYPRDPNGLVRGAASRPTTLGLLAHEVGHRWLARARISIPDVPGDALLGRQLAHWSFFFDSDASFLEGNDIEQSADRSFATRETVSRYSRLDLYLMGLAPASEVSPFFFVENASASGFGGPLDAESSPRVGVNIVGDRRDVLVDDLELALGPRRPGFESSPKSFRHAWVLLTRRDAQPSSEQLAQLGDARNAFAPFFNDRTLGRGTIVHALER